MSTQVLMPSSGRFHIPRPRTTAQRLSTATFSRDEETQGILRRNSVPALRHLHAMTSPRKLHFSTHAELKNVIGQDLINDDNIAIIELVKNGIDAGAEKITLTFEEDDGGGRALTGSLLIVEDNGAGMTLQDVEQKWLNIAFSEKKDMQGDGRLLAGNKGVGRFACDRLGTRLDMFTRGKGGPLLHVTVNWTAFENKKKIADTIQKVDILQAEVTSAEMQKLVGRALKGKGTVLVVSGLRQVWERDRLSLLKRNLQRFVNPIAAFDSGSVSIEIKAPEQLEVDLLGESHDCINGVVENQVFEKLKFKTTYIQVGLDSSGSLLTTELFHEGQRVYRLVEERNEFAPLRSVTVVLHYMNSYKKAYFKRLTGIHVVNFGSVFLFINGYRVSPYGDSDNDWLQLDSRKGQGTGRSLGVRELLGIVDVRDRETKLRIVSNREGVIRDSAFANLTSRSGLVFAALTRLERFVVDGLGWDSVPENLRNRLKAGAIPGEIDMPEGEVYTESNDLKRRRIAMDVLRIVGASPTTARELEIDPEILDALSQEREDDVKNILQRFEAFDQTVVGHDVRLALGRVQREFERQKEELSKARRDVSRKGSQVERLKTVARGIASKNVQLERQVKTQETELMFSRISSGTDHEQLMLLHHQSGIYAESAKNFLERGLSQLRKGSAIQATELFEKGLSSINKVVTVTNFATKANFRLKTGTLTTDIAQFIQEYLLNVVKDGSAQGLKLSVTRTDAKAFVMRFKPIELAIVFDNLASNSTRALAKKLNVEISHPAENELRIEVTDDGRAGLSPDVQPPERIFERGVTTTNGSGLGLYHVRETIKQLGGSIQIKEKGEAGFGLVIRLFK